MSTESTVAVSTGGKGFPTFGFIAEGVTDNTLEVVESVLRVVEVVEIVEELVVLFVVTELEVLSVVEEVVELVVLSEDAGNGSPVCAIL